MARFRLPRATGLIPDFPRPHHPARSILIETLANGQNLKRRTLRMRACDEKNEKDKTCLGHLKRWYGAAPELLQRFGSEIYRCERCHTLYLPNERETPRSKTLSW